MKKIIITTLSLALAVMIGIISTKTANADNHPICQPTDFTAEQYTVPAGGGTVLFWDTYGCDTVSIVPAEYPGDRPPYGSVSTGAIHRTTVYTLTAYDMFGNIGGQRILTITVNGGNSGGDDASNCRINEFKVDGDNEVTINERESVELSWETTGCDRAKITPEIGTVPVDGDEEVKPDQTTTYTLTAYDENGSSVTKTVRVRIEEIEDCSIDEFTANDYSIESGQSVTIRWRTTGADDIDIAPGYSNQAADGSVSVRPDRTTTYRLEVNCRQGSNISRNLTINVSDTRKAPQAITTVATVFGPNSAQLNGIAIPNTTTGSTSAWFEWGRTTNLGSRTNAQSINSNNNSNYYSDVVSGLQSGNTYYYRAVVQNQNGTAYGDIVRFQTKAVTVTTPPTVVRTQTIRNVVVAQSAPSLLELKIDSAYDRMCVGGQINYTVTYTNISSQTLKNTVLQINHQKEVTFVSSSMGNYDAVDRTVTVEIGSVAPGQSGTIRVQGAINDTAVPGNLTVMTATVVYTNTVTRAQENAIAYSLVTVSADCPNVLGASTFGFAAFLPNTLLGWLLLILVILALVVLARQLYRQKEVRTTTL